MIPICCFRYLYQLLLLYFTRLVFWKSEEPVRTGGTLDSAYTKTPWCFFGIICLSLFFFVLNTGVGGVGGWAARVRARTRTRNIPSPSFARGSLRGAQTRWEGDGVGDDVSRTGYRFIPLSRSPHVLGPYLSSISCNVSDGKSSLIRLPERVTIPTILHVFLNRDAPRNDGPGQASEWCQPLTTMMTGEGGLRQAPQGDAVALWQLAQ